MQWSVQPEASDANVLNSITEIYVSKLLNNVDRQAHYCCNYMELSMSHYLCCFD